MMAVNIHVSPKDLAMTDFEKVQALLNMLGVEFDVSSFQRASSIVLTAGKQGVKGRDGKVFAEFKFREDESFSHIGIYC